VQEYFEGFGASEEGDYLASEIGDNIKVWVGSWIPQGFTCWPITLRGMNIFFI